MAENRFPCAPSCSSRDTVCIETNRVLDSCRDRDCFEDVRVYLSNFGCDVLDRTSAIRAKSAQIVWACISIEPIPFNRGFYAVNIRLYVKLQFEACIGGGGRTQELEGMSVIEKRVILYGCESNVNIFKSQGLSDGFCCEPKFNTGEKNVPMAIVETVDPVVLSVKIMEKASDCKCVCCCCETDVPEYVAATLESPLVFDNDNDNGRFLTVSLGIFSVVRIVRPAQYLIQATEYCIPEKECHPVEEDDPCKIFRSIPFPVGEFCPCTPQPPAGPDRPGRCGCGS